MVYDACDDSARSGIKSPYFQIKHHWKSADQSDEFGDRAEDRYGGAEEEERWYNSDTSAFIIPIFSCMAVTVNVPLLCYLFRLYLTF